MPRDLEVIARLKDLLSGQLKTLSTNIGNTAKSIGGSFGAMAASIKSTFLSLPALIGGVIAALGIRKLIQDIEAVVKAASIQEEAEMRLASALKLVGGFTQSAFEANLKLASSLQSVTKFGDEAIIAAQGLLVQFGVQPQFLERATKATLDWASALGKDLQSAAIDVAKASEGNLMMLGRYGVRVSEADFKTRGFVAVLEALEKRVGGTAEAVGNTFGGQVTKLNNLISDLRETIGGIIIRSKEWGALVAGIRAFFEQFIQVILRNDESIKTFSDSIATTAQRAFKFFINVAFDVAEAFVQVAKTITDAAVKIQTVITNLFPTIENIVALAELRVQSDALSNTLGELEQIQNELTEALQAGFDSYRINAERQQQMKQTTDQLTGSIKTLKQELPVQIDFGIFGNQLSVLQGFADGVVGQMEIVREETDSFREGMEEMAAAMGEQLARMDEAIGATRTKQQEESAAILQTFRANLVEGTAFALEEFVTNFGRQLLITRNLSIKTFADITRAFFRMIEEMILKALAFAVVRKLLSFGIFGEGGIAAPAGSIPANLAPGMAAQKGGITRGPAIALVGEKEPELIAPVRALLASMQRTAVETAMRLSTQPTSEPILIQIEARGILADEILVRTTRKGVRRFYRDKVRPAARELEAL